MVTKKTSKKSINNKFSSFRHSHVGLIALVSLVIVVLSISLTAVGRNAASIDAGKKSKKPTGTVNVITDYSKPSATSNVSRSKIATSTPAAVAPKATVTSVSPYHPSTHVVVPSPTSVVSQLAPTPTTSPPASTPPSATAYVPGSYTSLNWSGYMANDEDFDGISASWTATAPTTNNSSVSADGTWIGIGGITTSDLIQIGTNNLVSSSGRVTTSAFYELLPAYANNILSITINPGDSISASISEPATNLFILSLIDNTNSETFSTTLSYHSSNSSAEWIEEDPSSSNYQLYPLDNFGTVSFSGASVMVGSQNQTIAESPYNPITMVNSLSEPVATTSVLGSDGASFSVTHN